MSQNLSMPIDKLNLSTRARNALRKLGIQTLDELANMDASSLADLNNCGKQTISELCLRLDQVKAGTFFSASTQKVYKMLRVPFDPNKNAFLRDAEKLWSDEVDRQAVVKKLQQGKVKESYSIKEHLNYRRLAMVRLFLDGKSVSEIGREKGISTTRVNQILRAEARKYRPDLGEAVTHYPIEDVRKSLRYYPNLADRHEMG